MLTQVWYRFLQNLYLRSGGQNVSISSYANVINSGTGFLALNPLENASSAIPITGANPYALSFGTGLSSGSYNGSTAKTVAIAPTGVVAGAYGGPSSIPVFNVNAEGQITTVTNENTLSGIVLGAVGGTLVPTDGELLLASGGTFHQGTLSVGQGLSLVFSAGNLNLTVKGNGESVINETLPTGLATGTYDLAPYALAQTLTTLVGKSAAGGGGFTLSLLNNGTLITPSLTLAAGGALGTITLSNTVALGSNLQYATTGGTASGGFSLLGVLS
jgi:hypothetical protein